MPGREAARVSGLREHGDLTHTAAAVALGEQRRSGDHEVGGLQLTRGDLAGMAEDPDDVGLCVGDRSDAAPLEVDGHVGRAVRSAPPAVTPGAADDQAVRSQLAFYGSTPAYKVVLDAEGYGDLQPELNQLTKQGKWRDLAGLVDDGRIVTGCNVENAAYGVGLCAECGMVSELHATGGGRLVAVA